MERITEIFIKRPMLVNLVIIMIIIFGVFSVFENRKEGFPEISLNKIVVETIYSGALAII